MTADELREEINLEIELIDKLLQEISALRAEVVGREPLNREKTSAVAL